MEAGRQHRAAAQLPDAQNFIQHSRCCVVTPGLWSKAVACAMVNNYCRLNRAVSCSASRADTPVP